MIGVDRQQCVRRCLRPYTGRIQRASGTAGFNHDFIRYGFLTIFCYFLTRSIALVNTVDETGVGNALIDQARQRLGELSIESVFAACLHYLRRKPDDGFEWYERRPFITLLMIKWAVELWDPNTQRRAGTASDFDFVGQCIWDAIGKLVRVTRPSIFMRRMAFQQFWYQRSFDICAIPRQALLFGEIMAESPVVFEFVTAVGIEPRDFVRQLARMASQIGDHYGLPELAQLRPKPRHKDARDWPLMTQFLVVDFPELHRRIANLAKYETPREVELCEQTPLIRMPFLPTPRGNECVHHQVLFQSIATALYDVLRDRGPEGFMRSFGSAFESYVCRILEELQHEIISEHELQKILHGTGKCVDFAVVADGVLLLVDSKGIEGHYDERYHNLSEVLTKKLRTTALHAADQAIDTVKRLPDSLRRPLIVFVCVTYKQLNIGDGDALRDLTFGTDEWNAPRWQEQSLPPSQMFTISISELELLCGVIRAGVPIAKIFRQILTDNDSSETRKFLFEQHMARYRSVNIPDCAREAAYRLCDID